MKKEKSWEEELNKFYGCMFECGDYEALVEFIRQLLAEQRTKAKGMRVQDVSAWENYGKKLGYWDYFRKEVIEECIKGIEKIKKIVQKRHGTYKYDSCYDDVIIYLKYDRQRTGQNDRQANNGNSKESM